MKVLIAVAVSPFTGREESHWGNIIARSLKSRKIEVDEFLLPIVQDPLLLPEQMMALRLLNLDESSDLLITIGYPAFVLKHPCKKALLFSLASSLHNWFDTEYGVLSSPQYLRIQSAVINAGQKCLSEAGQVICSSKMLAEEINRDYHIRSKPLLLDDCGDDSKEDFAPDQGSWVVCESTLEPYDRMDLLLNSVACSKGAWRLNIFVPSSSEVYFAATIQRIERMGLKDRIFVTPRPISSNAFKDTQVYISASFNSVRIPEGAIRAVKCMVPVITTTDSGAIKELVVNETNGLIVKPSAETLAQAIDLVVANQDLREKLSVGNRSIIGRLVDVDTVIKELLD